MTLTRTDKIEIKELARAIVKEVLEDYNKNHIASCPHGRRLLKFACISIGIAIGSGFASGGLVLGIAKLVGAF